MLVCLFLRIIISEKVVLSSQKQPQNTGRTLLSADLGLVSTQLGGWGTVCQLLNRITVWDSNARQDSCRAATWNSLSLQWINCSFHLSSPEPQLTWSKITYYYYWIDTVVWQYLQIYICRHRSASKGLLFMSCNCEYASHGHQFRRKLGETGWHSTTCQNFEVGKEGSRTFQAPLFFKEERVAVFVLQLSALTVACLGVSCLSAMPICLSFEAWGQKDFQ